jgi:hypothetical protein
MYIFYTANIKKLTLNRGWHILKVKLYENANLLTKLLLLFVNEETKITFGYYPIVTHFKVLFGVKYILKQYYLY